MSNVSAARAVIASVRRLGVTEFCICAGSRNSPLLAVLGKTDHIRLFSFVDERAAAFFALGRSKLNRRPTAVVTTSGTAVAELLPAAIEAYYSGVPLVLITADRPARYRGTGAPQAIEQPGIFGVYASPSTDGWSAQMPLHLNLEFDEPLIDGSGEGATLAPPSAVEPTATPDDRPPIDIAWRHPLVLVGALASDSVGRVRSFLQALQAPVYAEALSGLREDRQLDLLLLRSGERILMSGSFDGVIRIGGVPTLRFWRDLEEMRKELPVVHFSDHPFPGMTRGEIYPLPSLPEVAARDRDESLFRRDLEMAERFTALLEQEPQSELAQVRRLSEQISPGSRLYLGNSLPIREWDLAASRQARGIVAVANRGANGIDGQLSTFFGQCDRTVENCCLIGDLTALYDLNAPWIVPQLEPDVRFRIVILNNGGGRIFSRVASLNSLDVHFRENMIENAHDLRFKHWAAMWNLPYDDTTVPRSVLEIVPDSSASERVWQRYDEMWS